VVLGIQRRALHMLDKCSTTEIQPRPKINILIKIKSGPGVVVHTCNPSYSGMETEGQRFKVSLGKVSATPFQSISQYSGTHMLSQLHRKHR
jgi:hypothetical protein